MFDEQPGPEDRPPLDSGARVLPAEVGREDLLLLLALGERTRAAALGLELARARLELAELAESRVASEREAFARVLAERYQLTAADHLNLNSGRIERGK